MTLLAQRHRDWGCLLVLPPQTSNVASGRSVLGASGGPSPKMRMSADSWQPERASLESCCSASSAHGTARTEAQRLGLLAYLATSKFTRSLGTGRVPARLLSPEGAKLGNGRGVQQDYLIMCTAKILKEKVSFHALLS